jgi:hypothetical protein
MAMHCMLHLCKVCRLVQCPNYALMNTVSSLQETNINREAFQVIFLSIQEFLDFHLRNKVSIYPETSILQDWKELFSSTPQIQFQSIISRKIIRWSVGLL